MKKIEPTRHFCYNLLEKNNYFLRVECLKVPRRALRSNISMRRSNGSATFAAANARCSAGAALIAVNANGTAYARWRMAAINMPGFAGQAQLASTNRLLTGSAKVTKLVRMGQYRGLASAADAVITPRGNEHNRGADDGAGCAPGGVLRS